MQCVSRYRLDEPETWRGNVRQLMAVIMMIKKNVTFSVSHGPCTWVPKMHETVKEYQEKDVGKITLDQFPSRSIS